MSGFFAFGGSYDSYYGNYGGGGVGPTSYNPYGTGSPAQSVYTGAGNAAPNAGAVGDQYGGRVANNTTLTVTNKGGNHIIATGTAAGLMAQADAIINVASYDNRFYTESYRSPVIYVSSASNTKIDFADNQTFKNYLSRSMSYLIPESAVAAAFQNTLGRPADQGNILNLENLINAGGSLSTVQWSIAHTAEAAARIEQLFNDVLGRSLDPATMNDWQNRLGTASLADMKSYLAHTPEATARIDEVYLQTLNHGVAADSIPGRQGQLAASSLNAVRWDLAHTDEAVSQIDRVYRETLNRGLDAGSVGGRQYQLGSPGSSLAAVQWDIAHTAEGTARIDEAYQQLLDRPLDAYSVPGRQDQLGSVSLSGVRWDLAHTTEASNRIINTYYKFLGHAPTTLEISIEQDSTRSHGGLLNAIVQSDEAKIDFDSNFYLTRNPDVALAGVNPYLHFILFGASEGRAPNALFDISYYWSRYPDLDPARVNPLLHFRLHGWREGRDPSADFSAREYLLAYKDIASGGIDPLDHYLNHGYFEGRQTFSANLVSGIFHSLLGTSPSQSAIVIMQDTLGRGASTGALQQYISDPGSFATNNNLIAQLFPRFFLFEEPPLVIRPPLPNFPSDPALPPGPGWAWKGPDLPGGSRGAWFKPETLETLKPDLQHPNPIGPHWDYITPGRGGVYRWFPDGRLEPKSLAAGPSA